MRRLVSLRSSTRRRRPSFDVGDGDALVQPVVGQLLEVLRADVVVGPLPVVDEVAEVEEAEVEVGQSRDDHPQRRQQPVAQLAGGPAAAPRAAAGGPSAAAPGPARPAPAPSARALVVPVGVDGLVATAAAGASATRSWRRERRRQLAEDLQLGHRIEAVALPLAEAQEADRRARPAPPCGRAGRAARRPVSTRPRSLEAAGRRASPRPCSSRWRRPAPRPPAPGSPGPDPRSRSRRRCRAPSARGASQTAPSGATTPSVTRADRPPRIVAWTGACPREQVARGAGRLAAGLPVGPAPAPAGPRPNEAGRREDQASRRDGGPGTRPPRDPRSGESTFSAGCPSGALVAGQRTPGCNRCR